jgi:hypothetical protein
LGFNNICGRAGGKKNANVAATTPTPPNARNASGRQTVDRIGGASLRPSARPLDPQEPLLQRQAAAVAAEAAVARHHAMAGHHNR